MSCSRSEPHGVDDAGVLDLLGGQVAGRVLGEQLGEDQQAVQRGAQLVAHVGEELGLVGGGDRELVGAVLQLLAGLLDLQVLGLDVPVLGGEQGGLVLQLGVGGLQLLLAGLQLRGSDLQFGGEALGLAEQLVRPGVGDDGVHVDADGLHQLFQEGLVHRGEVLERGELDDAEHLLLDDDRQHDQRGGLGPAQARGDAHVVEAGSRSTAIVRHAAAGGLADEGLAEPEPGGPAPHGEGVGPDQVEEGGAAGVLGEVEGAVLGGDERGDLVHDQLGDDGQVAPLRIRAEIRARLDLSQSCSSLARVVSRRDSTMKLMLSLRSATSPEASTVIERVRSPSATALVTSAIARTWRVRL